MKINVVMPRLTETMEEGTLSSWLKEPGDFVKKMDKLFEVETDKTVMEVEAVDEGFLCEILVKAGETAPVGAVLASLATTREECV